MGEVDPMVNEDPIDPVEETKPDPDDWKVVTDEQANLVIVDGTGASVATLAQADQDKAALIVSAPKVGARALDAEAKLVQTQIDLVTQINRVTAMEAAIHQAIEAIDAHKIYSLDIRSVLLNSLK